MPLQKGTTIGRRFSKTIQPAKNGRKKSRYNQMVELMNLEDPLEHFSKEDLYRLSAGLITCTKAQLEAMAKSPNIPVGLQVFIKGIVTDLQDGNIKTVTEIMDRVYGKSTQPMELSGSKGAPLIPSGPMSRKDYEAMLKKLQCGG